MVKLNLNQLSNLIGEAFDEGLSGYLELKDSVIRELVKTVPEYESPRFHDYIRDERLSDRWQLVATDNNNVYYIDRNYRSYMPAYTSTITITTNTNTTERYYE